MKPGDVVTHKLGGQTCTVKRVLVEVEVEGLPGRLFTYEAQNLEPGPSCCQCGKTTNGDGSPVLWKCQICDRNVCRDCTMKQPQKRGYPVEYFTMTLCSDECWDKAGRPTE